MEQPEYKPIEIECEGCMGPCGYCEDDDEAHGWTCDYCGIEISPQEVEANDHHCNSCAKRF